MAKAGDVITLSTGVKVKLKMPNIHLIFDLDKDGSVPEPPKQFIESTGIEEENTSDPDYRQALDRHMAKRAQKVFTIAIITGLDLVLPLPKGILKPADEGWTEILTLTGQAIATTPLARFEQWIKYYAAPSPEDFGMLLQPLIQMLGTDEKEVEEALAIFRGRKGRKADNQTRAPQIRRHRNQTDAPNTGAGPDVRGTRSR